MTTFNRYVVTVDVESVGPHFEITTEECTFSVAAVAHTAVPSALNLNQIPHVSDWEITNIEKQNK